MGVADAVAQDGAVDDLDQGGRFEIETTSQVVTNVVGNGAADDGQGATIDIDSAADALGLGLLRGDGAGDDAVAVDRACLLYTSPSPRD